MSYTKGVLVEDEFLTASVAQIGSYAVPANTITEIHSITLHNTNTVAEVVTLHYVPSAGSATGTNRKLVKTLAADETWTWNPYHYLSSGSQIHAGSTTLNKVNIRVDGAEVTQ